MRKNLHLSLLMLFAFVCNVTFAQEVTLDFTTNSWGLPEGSSNKATASQTFTSGDYTITLETPDNGYYYNTGDNYLMLGKKNATLTLPVFDFEVGQIVVTGRPGASGKTTQNIFVGETAVSTETTGVEIANKYDIAEASQAAGTIYVLKITSGHNSQITKIEIYKKGTSAEDKPAVDITNTPETAYTIAQANEIVAKGEGLNDSVYVKGFITEIKEVSISYGNASYFINDAAGATDGQIQVYRGYYLNGEKFTAEDQIGVGDEVIVYGKLSLYNNATQVAQKNRIYSIKKAEITPGDSTIVPGDTVVTPENPDTIVVDITNTPETAYSVEKAIELITKNEGLDSMVYVSGEIINIKEVSTSYGNATYTINESATSSKTPLTVFRGYYLNGEKFTAEDQIGVGDKVIVYGKLTSYNGNPQINTGSQIYSIVKAEVTPGDSTIVPGDSVVVPEETVATPVITPANKYVANSVEVTITADSLLKIYYTLDGTTPTIESTEYTAPFTLAVTDKDSTFTVNAIAVNAEGELSDVATQEYQIKVVKPMEVPEGHIGFDFIINPWGYTLGSGSGATAEAGDIKEAISQDGASISFVQGEASTPARMWSYNGGGQLRIYKKSTMTIHAPADKVITSVEIALAKGTLTIGESTEVVTTWTGSADSVAINCTANAQIETILIKIGDRPAYEVEAPVITPETGTYSGEQTVTISTEDATLSIFYTLDGSDPTDASNVYEGPFTVSETTTIKAIATNDDDVPSAVTTAVITIMPTYTTISGMLNDITTEKVNVMYTFENLLVMGVAKANVYVHDGTNAFLLYSYDAPFKAGDRISGSVVGDLFTYNNLPELSLTGDKWANVTVASSGEAVVPTVKTVEEVTNAILNEYIRLENLTFVEKSGTNYTFTDGTNNIVIRDNFSVMPDSVSTSEKYNVNAFVAIYKETIQIYPLTEDDFELVTNLKKAEAAWENDVVTAKMNEVIVNKFTTLSDGKVTYTSSNENVATVDSLGVVSVIGYGSAVITASTPETATYLADDASYTINVISDGNGTFENPYLVSDALADYVAGDTIKGVWVKGYIVGYVPESKIADAVFDVPTDSLKSNMLIAASADETDYNNCLAIQLPKGFIREGLDVLANGLYKAEVYIYGDIMKYFGVAGLKNPKDYSLDGNSTANSINGVEVEKNAPKGIFTLSGQKVNVITKSGIYIIDGKKVFVK